jgi:hypothetical protein
MTFGGVYQGMKNFLQIEKAIYKVFLAWIFFFFCIERKVAQQSVAFSSNSSKLIPSCVIYTDHITPSGDDNASFLN